MNPLNSVLVFAVVLLIIVVVFLSPLIAVRCVEERWWLALVPRWLWLGILQGGGGRLVVYRDVLLQGSGVSSPKCRVD